MMILLNAMPYFALGVYLAPRRTAIGFLRVKVVIFSSPAAAWYVPIVCVRFFRA
jgi:hypothetical protein